MILQFNTVALLLVALIVLGILGHNHAITISAAVLLIMQQTNLSKYLPLVDSYGLTIGITILTIGVLAPMVSGRIQLPQLNGFMSLKMLAAVAVGIFVSYLGGRGVGIIAIQPLLITGLLIGTIIGVAFFKGIPIGPLIAAGMLALIIDKLP